MKNARGEQVGCAAGNVEGNDGSFTGNEPGGRKTLDPGLGSRAWGEMGWVPRQATHPCGGSIGRSEPIVPRTRSGPSVTRIRRGRPWPPRQ